MAIRITEDGTVIYENEPNIDRELFPNTQEGLSQEQITQAVADWLDDHPEATTTVEDGSITRAKLDSELNSYLDSVGNDISSLNEDITNLKDEIFTTEESILVDKSNINTAEGGTLNVTLGQTFSEGVEYTVTIEASASQNRDSSVYWRNSTGNLNAIGYIPAGDTTATFVSTPSADGGSIRINSCIPAGSYRIIIKYSTVYSKIDQIDTIVHDIHESVENIGNITPITDLMTFVHGYWNSVNSYKTNVIYRVMCRTPIQFTKDVIICALNGFGLSGYIDETFFSNMGVIAVPASAELKLYIRRVWEDTSESADIREFTTGIYILNYNASTEYDLMKSTFSGIEMFRSAGFIGDSYTATRLGYSWVDIVQNLTGVICTKYAKSGADSGSWINASSYGLPALLSDTPKDLYWLALGINDGDRVDSDSNYLGSLSDLTGEYENYPDTFYGNTGHIIEAITAYAPDAKIVLYKPIFTSVKRTLSGISATQNGLKQVRDAIGDIAEHYNLPVIDALDDPLYQSYFYSTHMDSAVSAGTHPSVMLYPGIAKANLRLFAKCVQKYDTYFMDLNYTTDLNL